MAYWDKVLLEINDNQYNNADLMMIELQRAYLNAASTLEKRLYDVYIRIMEDGEVSALSLYKEGRYINLINAIREEVNKLGVFEERTMLNGLSATYASTAKETGEVFSVDFAFIPKEQIDKVVAMNWSGRNFAASVWNNKDALIRSLDKNISNVIITGKSKDELIKTMQDTLNVGFSNADRLVRTETQMIINQAQKDVYIAAGFTEYKFIAAHDKRTSKICKELDGSIFRFDQAAIGVNFPVMHPRCRSTIVPILTEI